MKKSSNGLFNQISTEAFKNLTSTVSETLFTESNHPASKTFTSAELWNIQRQGKTRVQRRYSL